MSSARRTKPRPSFGGRRSRPTYTWPVILSGLSNRCRKREINRYAACFTVTSSSGKNDHPNLIASILVVLSDASRSALCSRTSVLICNSSTRSSSSPYTPAPCCTCRHTCTASACTSSGVMTRSVDASITSIGFTITRSAYVFCTAGTPGSATSWIHCCTSARFVATSARTHACSYTKRVWCVASRDGDKG